MLNQTLHYFEILHNDDVLPAHLTKTTIVLPNARPLPYSLILDQIVATIIQYLKQTLHYFEIGHNDNIVPAHLTKTTIVIHNARPLLYSQILGKVGATRVQNLN